MGTQLLKTVKPSGGDYTTLEACMNANEQNLITADKYFDVEIDGSWVDADTTLCILHNYITDATRYINIYTTAAARHPGCRDATKYRITTSINYESPIDLFTLYTTINGLQCSGMGISSRGIYFESAVNYSTILNCIAYDCTENGFNIQAATRNYLINCLALHCGGNGFNMGGGDSAYLYNCIALNNTGNGFYVVDYRTLICKNCYAGGNAADYVNQGSGTLTLTTCHSSDGSGNTTTTVANCKFTSSVAGSENIHIASDSALKDVATDLHADAIYAFNTDIDGDLRPDGTWDVGADEYVAAAGSGPTLDAEQVDEEIHLSWTMPGD